MPKNGKGKNEIDLTPEEIQQLLENNTKLQERLSQLEKAQEAGIVLKTHRFGALQISGLRQGYVGFYRDEWRKILDMAPQIEAYLADHDDVLTKSESYEQFPSDVRKAK